MKPSLKLQHIVNRKVFVNEHLKWILDKRKTVIWTDESSFELGRNNRQIHVWRRAGKEYKNECTGSTFKSGRASYVVWGAVAYGQKSKLVIMDKASRTTAGFVDQAYEGPLLEFMS